MTSVSEAVLDACVVSANVEAVNVAAAIWVLRVRKERRFSWAGVSMEFMEAFYQTAGNKGSFLFLLLTQRLKCGCEIRRKMG